MLKAAPSLPVTAGVFASIRILYPVPAAVPAGMAILMLPVGLLPVTVAVPTVVAAVKLPALSLSKAVKVAPLYTPADVYATVAFVAAAIAFALIHTGVVANAPVVIDVVAAVLYVAVQLTLSSPSPAEFAPVVLKFHLK